MIGGAVQMTAMTNITATAALALVLVATCGCSREEAPAAAAPDNALQDKAFIAELGEQSAKRGELARARGAVVAKMEEMIEAKKKALGIATAAGKGLSPEDEAKLKAELEKDPEWKELYARCEDANTAITEARRKANAMVRERLAQPPAK